MRRVKASVNLFEKASRPLRVNGRTCKQCPDYQDRQRWCPILASVRMPDTAVCGYGERRIRSLIVKRSIEKRAQDAQKRHSKRSPKKTDNRKGKSSK